MNSYDSIDSLFVNVIQDIMTNGHETDSRNGPVKECLGAQLILENIDHPFLMNERRKLSPYYACAETLWYLSFTNSIEMIKTYAPQYENFADEDGTTDGAYGYRMWHNLTRSGDQSFTKNQLDLVIETLKNNPNSRQAIVTFWEADDLYAAINASSKDVPCTLCLQFLIRDNELVLITTMRSNDIWLGMPYDIFAFTCIQRLVGQALGVKCGAYIHQAGSLHLYEKHWKSAREAMHNPYFIHHGKPIWPTEKSCDWRAEVTSCLHYEEWSRTGDSAVTCFKNSGITEMMFDLSCTTAHKWKGGTPKVLAFDLLKGISHVNN